MVILKKINGIFFQPLNMYKTLDEMFSKTPAQRAAVLRLKGPVPEQYPNGWFRIFDSIQLKIGQVEQVKAFGQQLVVFRTEKGKAAVLDAYCPHLGANLAIEGTVVGETVRCPFHGWQFDVTGKCTH